ncbi:ATP-dependent DNA helicase RecQ, partial [Phlyctochytrium arcticum]
MSSKRDQNKSLEEQLLDSLKIIYGYSEFRPLQLEVCLSFMQGVDTALVTRTGRGKSLCFALPAIMHRQRALTIMVMPTISLMQDQYKELISVHIPAAFLTG